MFLFYAPIWAFLKPVLFNLQPEMGPSQWIWRVNVETVLGIEKVAPN